MGDLVGGGGRERELLLTVDAPDRNGIAASGGKIRVSDGISVGPPADGFGGK